jgi:hypothetical protein
MSRAAIAAKFVAGDQTMKHPFPEQANRSLKPIIAQVMVVGICLVVRPASQSWLQQPSLALDR